MTIGTFDLTQHTQFAIRYDTGLFPKQQSFCLFTCTDNDMYDGREKPFYVQCNDAVEWDRQVQLAHWIIEMDEKYVPKGEASE